MSEEVKSMYDEIKKKKNHRYLVFYIKDEKTIAVEKIGIFSFTMIKIQFTEVLIFNRWT